MCHQLVRNAVKFGGYTLPKEPRTGIISRIEIHQGMAATHSLVNHEQILSAGLQIKQGTAATHRLKSQGQVL
jgi:hypothetical protein